MTFSEAPATAAGRALVAGVASAGATDSCASAGSSDRADRAVRSPVMRTSGPGRTPKRVERRDELFARARVSGSCLVPVADHRVLDQRPAARGFDDGDLKRAAGEEHAAFEVAPRDAL